MTTLIAWASFPTYGAVNAIYLASDSRITWGNSSAQRWDAGRKLFHCVNAPHAFGYCGDVVFPTQVLAQVVAAVDLGMAFDSECSSEGQHSAIVEIIKYSYGRHHNAPDQNFDIIHAHREGSGLGSRFRVWRISYDARTNAWSDITLRIPRKSTPIIALGSGASSVRHFSQRWRLSDAGITSRSVYSAFCDSLRAKRDPRSGGPPQLAAIFLAGPSQALGVYHQGQRYLHGLPLPTFVGSALIEWRDDLGQNVRGEDGRPVPGARRFVRPRNI